MLNLLKRNHDPEVALTITNETFFRLLFLIIVSIVVLAVLRRATHALLLIFTAFFLSLALNAPVHWLAEHIPGKNKGSRSLATSFSFLAVVLAIAAFFANMGPPLVRQTENFINSAPQYVRSVKTQDSGLGHIVRKYKLEGTIDDFSKQLGARVKHAGGAAVTAVTSVTSSLFSVLTILVLTFMMLVEGPRWHEFFRELVPKSHRGHVDRLSRDMYQVIKGYVNGQVTLALIAATLITPAVFILHISYPIALMLIIFICGLIPLVGHTIGAITITLVALFHSPASALIILAYYEVYIQIEAYVIQPKIQANSTNMSPLLVFMSMVVGVSFGGLFGGLVAIPVGGCIRVLVLDYLQSRSLTGAPVIAEEIKEIKNEVSRRKIKAGTK